jgi:NAD(P)-dependent dehydrogenase (short-subunit alcohol dehydrogenase family)
MGADPQDVFSVSGRQVVITGGTAGIGLAVARHLVEAGATVTATGRRSDGAAVAAAVGAAFVAMDVTNRESVDAGFAEIASRVGQLDALILNAGVDVSHGEVDCLDLDAFERVLDVNTMGVVRSLAAGVGLLSTGASVIVTSSPAGSMAVPGMAAYSASKAALDNLVRTWALELGPKGIRVNAVLPGIVESEMESESTPQIELIRRMTANGKYRRAADLGPVFHFLVSDASVTLTGSSVGCHDGLSVGFSHEALTHLAGDLDDD